MLAVSARDISAEDPLSVLEVGDHADPDPPEGWEVVEVRAASLNHHDLWTLRGVATPKENLPIVLGSDAAGVTADGREVVIHAVVGGPALDPSSHILSEKVDGTHAERVAVPSDNLVDKPAGLSFAEACCLPTAYLTAYRMLFTKAELRAGQRVLIQGASGGVATAAILLGRAAGLTVYVTGRTEDKRARAEELGADAAFENGARLPERVDAVIETVGEATFDHSVKSLGPGGTIVVSGATSGPKPPLELARVFFRELRVLGASMGTPAELASLMRLLSTSGVRPLIDGEFPLADARDAYERMLGGDHVGKLVLTVGG